MNIKSRKLPYKSLIGLTVMGFGLFLSIALPAMAQDASSKHHIVLGNCVTPETTAEATQVDNSEATPEATAVGIQPMPEVNHDCNDDNPEATDDHGNHEGNNPEATEDGDHHGNHPEATAEANDDSNHGSGHHNHPQATPQATDDHSNHNGGDNGNNGGNNGNGGGDNGNHGGDNGNHGGGGDDKGGDN